MFATALPSTTTSFPTMTSFPTTSTSSPTMTSFPTSSTIPIAPTVPTTASFHSTTIFPSTTHHPHVTKARAALHYIRMCVQYSYTITCSYARLLSKLKNLRCSGILINQYPLPGTMSLEYLLVAIFALRPCPCAVLSHSAPVAVD